MKAERMEGMNRELCCLAKCWRKTDYRHQTMRDLAWQGLQRFLATAEELKPGFIYSFQSTAFAVHHNNKLFAYMLRLFLNTFRSLISAIIFSCRPGVLCHADQAVFILHPWKCDTVSQPVRAWNRGRAVHLEGPIWADSTWIEISRIFFPLPRQTH